MRQARRDLEHACKDVADGYYEHACFGAHQAAEKAVKAAYQARHAEGWGHRVGKLLESFETVATPPPPDMIDAGKVLDQYYIPARDPNGFESGAPMDFFTKEQAEDAVRRAGRIIEWCEDLQGA